MKHDNNTIEIRKIPNIPDKYDYFGSIDDFKELITNNIHISESIVTQTETLNEYQRPPKFHNYLKSLLPLWCSPNVSLNDISSTYLSPKISKENLKEILQYVLSDVNINLNTSLKYEGLISPKSKKPVAKSIFKI
ncbi:hypothetical protein PIROE2DRAFT_10834 [Piromyces sp. E2]|nr:hypothetical protein PIROE2DRAFT_10834 [Piromyces sp. E2]|eukprot:OUM62800.1 hypothetical protein PIROE2DRAFT_10834 [Piromyces sp. E2]